MPMPIELILYGRETCHLCHDMWAELRVFQVQNPHSPKFTVAWVDIQEQPNLQETYGWRIPVLTDVQANLICEGHLDQHRLSLHLQHILNSEHAKVQASEKNLQRRLALNKET